MFVDTVIGNVDADGDDDSFEHVHDLPLMWQWVNETWVKFVYDAPMAAASLKIRRRPRVRQFRSRKTSCSTPSYTMKPEDAICYEAYSASRPRFCSFLCCRSHVAFLQTKSSKVVSRLGNTYSRVGYFLSMPFPG